MDDYHWNAPWRAKAACLDQDTELFFAAGTTGRALEQVEEAKAFCRRCEVISQCREWAMATHQHDGVWGGLSEDERHQLRRRRGRAGKADSPGG